MNVTELWRVDAPGDDGIRAWFSADQRSVYVSSGHPVAYAALSLFRHDGATGEVKARCRTRHRTVTNLLARPDELVALTDRRLLILDPGTLDIRHQLDIPSGWGSDLVGGDGYLIAGSPGSTVIVNRQDDTIVRRRLPSGLLAQSRSGPLAFSLSEPITRRFSPAKSAFVKEPGMPGFMDAANAPDGTLWTYGVSRRRDDGAIVAAPYGAFFRLDDDGVVQKSMVSPWRPWGIWPIDGRRIWSHAEVSSDQGETVSRLFVSDIETEATEIVAELPPGSHILAASPATGVIIALDRPKLTGTAPRAQLLAMSLTS